MTLKRKRVLCREKRTLTARTEKGETMSRLIDAEKLDVFSFTCPKGMDIDSFIAGMGAVLDRIYEAPTVDAVEVIHCKDCEYYVETNGRIGTCELTISGAEDDWFCAWGVRKDDERLN